MSVDDAIVNLSLQGAEQVSTQADRVTADLSSVVRAGTAAEAASKSAADALSSFEGRVSAVVGTLHTVERLAHRLGKHAGLNSHDENKLSAFGEGLSTFAQTESILAPLNSNPYGAAAAFGISAVAGIYSGVSRYSEDEAKDEEREEKRAEKLLKHLQHLLKKSGAPTEEGDLADELLKQAGLARLNRVRGGQ